MDTPGGEEPLSHRHILPSLMSDLDSLGSEASLPLVAPRFIWPRRSAMKPEVGMEPEPVVPPEPPPPLCCMCGGRCRRSLKLCFRCANIPAQLGRRMVQ